MSKVEVNQVTQQCGTTLTVGGGACKTAVVDATTVTLGRCGGTVSLASGATQSGFGRTGTVDWDTSIKTGTVTAVSGSGYFVDTTSGGITVNLPAASVGDIVAISDYASTSASNAITVNANGSEKINGVADRYKIETNGLAVTLVYADATKGWKSVTGSDADATGVVPAFVTASGGNQPTATGCIVCTNYKIHTFTGPGTLVVSDGGNAAGSETVDYLIVAGGGSGGAANGGGAGGGAGGFRFSNSTCMPAPLTSPLAACAGIPVTATPYAIVVGGGGTSVTGNAPSTPGEKGNSGSDSSGLSYTAAGGGGGGGGLPNCTGLGRSGGSGGGAGGQSYTGPGGAGDTPPTTPAQGFPGGPGNLAGNSGSGGGGAGAIGATCTPGGCGGPGGIGSFVVQTGFGGCYGTPGPVGSTRYFAGGGGANAETPSAPAQGTGGAGGGGAGGVPASGGTAGGTNTGGGGGGVDGAPTGQTSGAGGSGIVIIRYKFQ